ncbi:hypothetical protein [Pseudomonas brassicacearum]|uniref:Uncharacterized protein n=1 Tax=Pseudomonas brassicacearum TaxID=930166 RepID=A0A423H1W9_9PSED|nr:hypothetical protein [Pseudomonas brassicacearum]RON06227.1 hypothetical protein BK658_00100 [Pseudomonas brassicacearum]
MSPAAVGGLPSSTQAQAFAAGIRRLERAIGRELWGEDSVSDAALVYELPEYAELLEEAYASGFVRGDLSHQGFDFDVINARPQAQLSALPYSEVCRYVHALYRCERHNWGWGSLVLWAIQSGALGIIASKLEACSSLAPR